MPLPRPRDCAQLYYDGRCPLCAREMALLHKLKNVRLELLDIHEIPDLSHAEQEQMLRNLHLQMPDGTWHIGIDANLIAWSFTPVGFLWRPLRWKLWAGVVERMYGRWADQRYCRIYQCSLPKEKRL